MKFDDVQRRQIRRFIHDQKRWNGKARLSLVRQYAKRLKALEATRPQRLAQAALVNQRIRSLRTDHQAMRLDELEMRNERCIDESGCGTFGS